MRPPQALPPLHQPMSNVIDQLLGKDFKTAAATIENAKLLGTPYDLIPCNDFTIEGRLKAIHAEAKRRAPHYLVLDIYSNEPGLRSGIIYLLMQSAFKPGYTSVEEKAFATKRPDFSFKLATAGLFQHFETESLRDAIAVGEQTNRDPVDILNERWAIRCLHKEQVKRKKKHHDRTYARRAKMRR